MNNMSSKGTCGSRHYEYILSRVKETDREGEKPLIRKERGTKRGRQRCREREREREVYGRSEMRVARYVIWLCMCIVFCVGVYVCEHHN